MSNVETIQSSSCLSDDKIQKPTMIPKLSLPWQHIRTTICEVKLQVWSVRGGQGRFSKTILFNPIPACCKSYHSGGPVIKSGQYRLCYTVRIIAELQTKLNMTCINFEAMSFLGNLDLACLLTQKKGECKPWH